MASKTDLGIGDSTDPFCRFSLLRVNVDWQVISTVDIDRVISQGDVEVLHRYLDFVTFCNLDSLKCDCGKPADPNVTKLFRLAQLSLQWVRDLRNTAVTRCIEIQAKNRKLQSKVDEQSEDIKTNTAEIKALTELSEKQRSLLKIKDEKEPRQSLQDENGRLQDENERLQEEDVRSLQEERSLQDNSCLQEEMRKLQKEMRLLQDENKTLQEEKKTLQEEKKTLQEENKTLQGENGMLRQDVRSLLDKNKRLQKKEKSRLQENIWLQEKMRKLHDDHRELQEETKLYEEANMLRKEIDKYYQQEISKLQEQNGRMKEKEKKCLEENSWLQQEMKKLQEEKNKLQETKMYEMEDMLQKEMQSMYKEEMNNMEEEIQRLTEENSRWQIKLQVAELIAASNLEEGQKLYQEGDQTTDDEKIRNMHSVPPNQQVELPVFHDQGRCRGDTPGPDVNQQAEAGENEAEQVEDDEDDKEPDFSQLKKSDPQEPQRDENQTGDVKKKNVGIGNKIKAGWRRIFGRIRKKNKVRHKNDL